MLFRLLTLAGAIALAALSFWQMPKIQDRAKNNPQVLAWIKVPDRTYAAIDECQKQVDNAERCYSAWSAGVALAESDDCSDVGLFNKRRFKQLIEHIADDDIDKEIAKECIRPQV